MGLLSEIMQSLMHPSEIQAMFQVKFSGIAGKEYSEPLNELATSPKLSDVEFCYAVLNKVSRSFAFVIQQLPNELKDAVCIFYLVLRGLDSVEDDMTYPNNLKLPLLQNFYKKLQIDDWHIEGVGDSPDYRILLAHFGKVIRVYKDLAVPFQKAISEICQKMGYGMADYAEKKVVSVEDYNLYCHYVAGLVGYGLSDLFSASGLEDPDLAKQYKISNSMGLFLQKTNIIRDYLEDLNSNRTFWPDAIWSKYATKLSDFRDDPHGEKSLACLNHLVTDALEHVPDCLNYLSQIKNLQIFRFCAIPQVMAIATLAAVYNNPNVFKKVVKIRKGLSCKLIIETNNMASVHECFHDFALSIEKRIPSHDPSAATTKQLVEQVKTLTPQLVPKASWKTNTILLWIIILLISYYLLSRYGGRSRSL